MGSGSRVVSQTDVMSASVTISINPMPARLKSTKTSPLGDVLVLAVSWRRQRYQHGDLVRADFRTGDRELTCSSWICVILTVLGGVVGRTSSPARASGSERAEETTTDQRKRSNLW